MKGLGNRQKPGWLQKRRQFTGTLSAAETRNAAWFQKKKKVGKDTGKAAGQTG